MPPHIWRNRDEGYQILGTDGNTFSAGFTCFPVNLRHTVKDMYGVKGTDLHTASIAKAAEITGFRPAIRHKGQHAAVMESHIIIIHFYFITGTAALDKSDHMLFHLPLHPHDGSHLFSYGSPAYRAGVHRRFSGSDCRSQPRTAGITAAAAVIAGQLRKNGFFLFIHFHLEQDGGASQKKTDKQSDTSNDCRSNQNSRYTHRHHPLFQ